MNELEIAFNTKDKLEYLIKYSLVEYQIPSTINEKYYILEENKIVPKKLGTFLLDFLNIDFNNFEKSKRFILEYIFFLYLLKIDNEISKHSKIGTLNINCDTSSSIILNESEIQFYLNEIYKKYKNEFINIQNIYKYIVNYEKYNNYTIPLKKLSYNVLNLKIRCFYDQFISTYNFQNISDIFLSCDIKDIFFISLRMIAVNYKNIKIQVCKNCNKFFIPETNHDTKYCDSLFNGKKTCRDIGNQKAYIENIEKDKLLKRYYSRYHSLAKQASTTSENSNSNKMYEYYKKEGKIMRKKYVSGNISAEEFDKWINNSMIRKK